MSALEQRPLGAEGVAVSAVGLGCMGMSEFYGVADRERSIATIRRAVELGVTLFDTADMYGQGENERLLATGLGDDRERVIIATKFGLVRDARGEFAGVDGSPAHARRACEASLERLGVETLDLYQLHRVDSATPIAETVGAMAELVREGKVRLIGLSEVSAEQLRAAAAEAPIAAVQSEYSLLERGVEDSVLPVCERIGAAFLAFAPLMRGLIARRFTEVGELDPSDARRQGAYPRLAGEPLARNVELARLVWSIAEERGVAPAQVAIAWLLSRAQRVIPIPGARTPDHLEQNVRALGLELGDGELERLDAVVGAGGRAAGERLPRRGHNRGVDEAR
jgi:aryl-alcohol dehydrogenase-like predicted oxidoreductase